ncbi:hypothetical protein D3C80_1406950 [compost metagenome]
MAFVQMRHDGLWLERFDAIWAYRLLTGENSHAGTLRLIVLAGNAQHVGPNQRTGFNQDLGQTVGIILLVYIGDIAVALSYRLGVTNIVDTKTQTLGQIIESMQLKPWQLTSPPLFLHLRPLPQLHTGNAFRQPGLNHGFIIFNGDKQALLILTKRQTIGMRSHRYGLQQAIAGSIKYS